jgi:hypothetical protein
MLKLKCDEPLSNVAFKFKLGRYNTEVRTAVVSLTRSVLLDSLSLPPLVVRRFRLYR